MEEWGIHELHRQGLAVFRQRLTPEHVRYADLLVLEHRLTENVEQTLRYGDTEDLRSARARIIDALNGLATELLGQSFLDLGAAAPPPRAWASPASGLSASPSGYAPPQGTPPPPEMPPPHALAGQRPSAGPCPPADTYYISSYIIDLITLICTSPGYYLVLADAGYGKTALMGYLARRRRPVTVAYSFTRADGRRSVDLALESLREQLRSLGNLTSAHNYSLTELIQHVVRRFQPWSSARRNNWALLLILLDGLDECEQSERGLFHELLPAPLPEHVSVVVTMRPAVRKAIAAHFSPGHPFCQKVGVRDLKRLRSADIRRLIFEQYHLYVAPDLCREIERLSGGHPASVFFICRYLEEAINAGQDPEAALTQIPPLHTFRDLFAHELDQMELRCTSADNRRLFRRLLGTLIAAQQPLQTQQIAEVLEVPPALLEALALRLDRFRWPTDDGSLAFGSPQFAEYLLGLDDWKTTITDARAGWDAWILRQQEGGGQPAPAAALIERVRGELLPTLQEYSPGWLAGWEAIFGPSIRSREDWLAAVNRVWESAELRAAGPADPTRAGFIPEELLIYALLITAWPQRELVLLPRGAPSLDHQQGLLLTDQLHDLPQLAGQATARNFATLMGLLAGDSAHAVLDFESFVLLVGELGQAWRDAPGHAPQQFAQILRLMTQVVRRQATVSPLLSPRANLLEALGGLAPAIQDHFPDSIEGICRVVDAFIDVLP